MVGSSRQTVTRSLDDLQRDGFVARRGHNYRLLVSPDCVASDNPALAGGERRYGLGCGEL
jgi:DNA-binding IclR family transcriptional regulator